MSDRPVSIIFGGSGGIGSAVARLRCQQNDQVVVVGRSQEKVEAVGAELNCSIMVCDVTQSSQVESCFEQILSKYNRIDQVVHAVGSILLKPIHLTTDREWQEVMDLNLNSAFFVFTSLNFKMADNFYP